LITSYLASPSTTLTTAVIYPFGLLEPWNENGRKEGNFWFQLAISISVRFQHLDSFDQKIEDDCRKA